MANADSLYYKYDQQTQCCAFKVCIEHIALDAYSSKDGTRTKSSVASAQRRYLYIAH